MILRRWSSLAAAHGAVSVLVAVVVAGCTRTAGPSETAQPRALRIEGPSTLAPRGAGGASVAQYRSYLTRSDGSAVDVTNNASWGTGAYLVAHTANRIGEIQAEGAGETYVTAMFQGMTATHPLMVLEPGTFKVSGTVSAADAGTPVTGARVQVVSGTGAGRETLTDSSGRYAIYGIAGGSEVRVSADGFEPVVVQTSVSASMSRDFTLAPSTDYTANLTGDWRVTLSIAPQCRSVLPEVIHERQYDATIVQRSAQLEITLFGPQISQLGVPGSYKVYAAVFGRDVSFDLGIGPDDFYIYSFIDRLTPTAFLQIDGHVRGEIAGEIRGALESMIYYFTSPPPSSSTRTCFAADHRFVFQRR